MLQTGKQYANFTTKIIMNTQHHNKQEVQGPCRSSEYHATRNALNYAVGNFMFVTIICCLTDSSQYSNIAENSCEFSIILNFHTYGPRVKDFLESSKFLAVLVVAPVPQDIQTLCLTVFNFIFYAS
jgi:glycerol uptake facilitator-like aquaporin